MLSHCILDVILYILFCYLTDIFIGSPRGNVSIHGGKKAEKLLGKIR